jgi:L-asparaginase
LEPAAKLALVIAGNFSGDEENADPCSLLNYLPESLVGSCRLIEWSCQPSSHYSMKMTVEMANMFETLVEDGYAGIIVISGSGVMEEMAYLTDLLWQHDQPVIFANLMVRGRAGVKEGLMNLHCAVQAALSPEAEGKGVLVCSSGELFAASEVVMVDPASLDNTFQSPEKGSIGKMLNDEIKFFRNVRRPEFLARRPEIPAVVEIMWASLGGGERILASLATSRELQGFVLAGFGTGNISPAWIPHVRNILRRRIPVAIVSRCFQGYVSESNYFEGSFKKLTEMGVMSAGKLNPYQARIRMSLGIAAGLTDQGLSLYMLNQSVSEDSPLLYK